MRIKYKLSILFCIICCLLPTNCYAAESLDSSSDMIGVLEGNEDSQPVFLLENEQISQLAYKKYAPSRLTDSQVAFVSGIGNAAILRYDELQVLPSLITAQAILESGWGTSKLSRYYNFFGIKATSNESYVRMETTEYIHGRKIRSKERFRRYNSYEHGLDGYMEKLMHTKRYHNVIGQKNYVKACLDIQKAGYATDPTYAKKLIHIIQIYHLNEFDKLVK